MYAGDIMEGILIVIFSYAFETSKINEFGKYIYINIAKLRDVSNTELLDWFKKARTIFENAEMKDFKKLLYEDYYLNDVISSNYKYPLIHTLIKEVTKNGVSIEQFNDAKTNYINSINLILKCFFEKILLNEDEIYFIFLDFVTFLFFVFIILKIFFFSKKFQKKC